MGMYAEFEEAVRWLGENLSFERDRNVSVFETNIRCVSLLRQVFAHLIFQNDGRAPQCSLVRSRRSRCI